jgi:hypothetical protein
LAPSATIRRLRAALQRAEEDRDDLREQLDAAYEEIRQPRARVEVNVHHRAGTIRAQSPLGAIDVSAHLGENPNAVRQLQPTGG